MKDDQEHRDFVGWLYDGPSRWPRKHRRIYAATFPLSAPLLLATQLLGCVILAILFAVIMPVEWLCQLWVKE